MHMQIASIQIRIPMAPMTPMPPKALIFFAETQSGHGTKAPGPTEPPWQNLVHGINRLNEKYSNLPLAREKKRKRERDLKMASTKS